MSKITTTQGNPEREEAQHIVQENHNRECRDTVDQFDFATKDANIDFSVSGIPEETVKRSETMNILELIRRITRHPQKQAVQNDLDKKQSFNAFSAESKKAIKESGNIEISEIVNTEPKLQCKFCLNHCNPGVIYCVCGRLMSTDSAENRQYLSSTLDSFPSRTFTSEKTDHVVTDMAKLPDAKNTTRHINLQRNVAKRGTTVSTTSTSGDKPFRSAIIEHSRTEQVILKMDKLANEDHSYKVSKNEIEFLPRQLVVTLKRGT